MTLPVYSSDNYTGNGNVSLYNYTFKIFNQNDLLVTQRNTSDIETTLTIGSAGSGTYTVTGVGNAEGGSIQLNGGNLPSNYKLTIQRKKDIKQETDIRNQGTFYPETHENIFDYLVMIDQQQQGEIDRSLKLSETVTGVSSKLPIPSTKKLLRWNENADAIENIGAGNLGVITAGKGLYLTPDNRLDCKYATSAASGIVQFSTDNETTTGTENGKAVTPKNVNSLFPLSIAKGGTGATTIAGAVSNLGVDDGTLARRFSLL
jgi:hypothetical protein